jgi:virulence factor
MIRFGMLDFDTSHCVAFTTRINHVGVAKDQFVDGGKVVIGCPGESKLSPERIEGFTKEMKKLGVPLVDKPEEMIGKVDAMLIEAVDGTVHYERAKPFLEAGLPCFIDKPFACSVADAKKIIALAEKHKATVFSSSSLRYAPEVVAFAADPAPGKLVGCAVHSPASLSPIPERNAGLFHYGIHGVEVLYTLMGAGCQRVTCVHEQGADVVTGIWKGGRIGTLRGIRDGKHDYGFTAFTAKQVTNVAISTGAIYRELCKKIIETFEKKKPVLDPAVTLEIVAFIDAANRSGENHGAMETVKF